MPDREYISCYEPILSVTSLSSSGGLIYGGECRWEYMAPLEWQSCHSAPVHDGLSALAIPCRRLSVAVANARGTT